MYYNPMIKLQEHWLHRQLTSFKFLHSSCSANIHVNLVLVHNSSHTCVMFLHGFTSMNSDFKYSRSAQGRLSNHSCSHSVMHLWMECYNFSSFNGLEEVSVGAISKLPPQLTWFRPLFLGTMPVIHDKPAARELACLPPIDILKYLHFPHVLPTYTWT